MNRGGLVKEIGWLLAVVGVQTERRLKTMDCVEGSLMSVFITASVDIYLLGY